MSRSDRWSEFERCRRAGLVVDEDFERGISPRQRRWRTLALAVIVIVLGVAVSYIAKGSGVQDAARRRQRVPVRHDMPVGAQPPVHTRGRT